jgi:hypothetical protein
MKFLQPSRLLILTFLSHAAVAQESPDDVGGPIGALETQLAAVAERVEALEANAPDPSVEGRTYCFVLDLTMMRGIGANQAEHLVTSIIRRTATFSGGSLSAWLSSHVRNTQTDDGVVTQTLEASPDPVLATYTQTGNRLDVTFANGTTANWYISRDGSVISGTSILSFGPFPNSVTVGQTRHWTLIENDLCDGEGV